MGTTALLLLLAVAYGMSELEPSAASSTPSSEPPSGNKWIELVDLQLIFEIVPSAARSPLLNTEGKRESFIKGCKAAMYAAGLETKDEVAHFLGQIALESGSFWYLVERGVAPGYTRPGQQYEGRSNSLGNTEPGDGERFKGRGWIQLTGRRNYQGLTDSKIAGGVDFVRNPELVATHEHAWKAVAWYWKEAAKLRIDKPNTRTVYSLSEFAKKGDVLGVTHGILGKHTEDRTGHLRKRRERTQRAAQGLLKRSK